MALLTFGSQLEPTTVLEKEDGNYKRTVIACFIQAVYLLELELDRQENKSEENALAPKWWIPFKYKLSQTLIDERDGSIFGAILEWISVLALGGTLLKSLTIRRDIEDDLQFFAWESLKGSVRFKMALEKLVAERYGRSNELSSFLCFLFIIPISSHFFFLPKTIYMSNIGIYMNYIVVT
ncbi:hypothetical protein UlMin_015788 [Ulmus minor]